MRRAEHIRNIAIIAHIDHGKTTLIDSIFKAAQVFRDNARVEERFMDNNELEREKGITIRAKHCTVEWKGTDQHHRYPGHADFSGEVERILSTVDSVLLLVDAGEGPMPQTRYVLSHALRMGIKPIVYINKVDRKEADPVLALNATFDLFFELGATDEQADFPVLYGSGLAGWAVKELSEIEGGESKGMDALFETVIEYVEPPLADEESPFLLQVSTLAWNEYTGRMGCGKILQGKIRKGEEFLRTTTAWEDRAEKENENFVIAGKDRTKAVQIFVTRGLERLEVEEAGAGDIVWISGPKEIGIGDTFCSPDLENFPLPPLDIEEPTVSMFFLVNNGPFSWQEGQDITLRQLKARLERELHTNVALRMEDLGRSDGVKVSGRGELQLAILIEEMRREGMEFCVSKPEVITEEHDGALYEPMEDLVIDIPEEYQGVVYEKLSRRKARVRGMESLRTGLTRLLFTVPTRGLIGYRGEFMTDTRGLGIMSSRFSGYAPWVGDIAPRSRGSLVSLDTGEATSYQLENLQERGTLFVSPMDRIYAGMIVGENSRPGDMPCNPTKKKQATNHRASTKEFTVKLDVPRRMSLEKAIEWIADDELVEVTPKSIRLRKSILDDNERRKARRISA